MYVSVIKAGVERSTGDLLGEESVSLLEPGELLSWLPEGSALPVVVITQHT